MTPRPRPDKIGGPYEPQYQARYDEMTNFKVPTAPITPPVISEGNVQQQATDQDRYRFMQAKQQQTAQAQQQQQEQDRMRFQQVQQQQLAATQQPAVSAYQGATMGIPSQEFQNNMMRQLQEEYYRRLMLNMIMNQFTPAG